MTKTTSSKGRQRFGVGYGRLAAAVMVLVVLTDLLRRSVSGEPIVLTTTPAALAWVGGATALLFHGTGWIPPIVRRALAFLVACVVWSGLVAAARGVSIQQIVIGAVALASPGPCLVLGLALSRNPEANALFDKSIGRILAASMLVAFLQQFGLLNTDILSMLEEARDSRGLESGGIFAYTSGPFRTANVFAFFLALAGAIMVDKYGEMAKEKRNGGLRLKWIAVLALIVLTSLLTGRRTGLSMLLGSVAPALFRARGTVLKGGVIVVIAVVLIATVGQVGSVRQTDLQYKIAHATSESDTSSRLLEAFNVKAEDWRLLSIAGDGLGSQGAGRSFGGQDKSGNTEFLREHGITHVGWFKDILAYGVFGMLFHFAWFGGLILASVRFAKRQNRISKWSTTGFLIMAVFNYYIVSTSWIQGLTGGLFFGLLAGVLLGRQQIRSTRGRSSAINSIGFS